MSVSLQPYGSASPDSGYIAWTPVPLVIDTGGTAGALRLTSRSAAGSVAKVVFLQARDQPPQPQIDVQLQGQKQTIFIAGAFQPGQRHNGASVDSKDVTVEARWVSDPGNVVASVDIMIRVRRNANELSDKAREDFLFALAKLNGIQVDAAPAPGPGRGIYVSDFVAMHVEGAIASEHGDSHFLPWHRLYLLDLERQLQAVRPTVTLPYWQFDNPAPNVFTEDFMGAIDQIPRDSREPGGELDSGATTPPARFALDNFLRLWQIGDVQGIPRTARFNPQTDAANGVILVDPNSGRVINFTLADEDATLKLGGGVPPENPEKATLGSSALPPPGFARMEGSPHGAAHMSFNGRLNNVPTAPEDPLFFLLHCNVDRLWARWQSVFKRDDWNDRRSYPYQKAGDTAAAWEIIDASQWPWDGGTSHDGDLRPPGTRKANFTKSSLVANFPNNSPQLLHAIDPYGYHDSKHDLGFGYDDVPYDHAQAVTS